MVLKPLSSSRQYPVKQTVIGNDGSVGIAQSPLIQLGIIGLALIGGYVALRAVAS